MRKKFGEVQIKRYMYAHKRRLANYQDNLFTGFNSACFFQDSKSQREAGLERERRTKGGKLYACLRSCEKHSKLKTVLQAIG